MPRRNDELPTPGSPAEEARTSVFVYGTLRAGGYYRPRIEPFVVASRPATIRARLFHFAPRGSMGEWPYVSEGSGIVVGELLELRSGAEALAILDEIEDAPDLYERRETRVALAEGETARAWVYFLPDERAPGGDEVLGGDWCQEIARGRTRRPPDGLRSAGDR